MTATIKSETWLQTARTEYLTSFIPEGGATVKFAVAPDTGTAGGLVTRLKELAGETGFDFALVKSETTRVHQMDQLFFAITSQVNWRHLATSILEGLAVQAGYEVPSAGPQPFLERLAQRNGIEPDLVRIELKIKLGNQVFKHEGMSRDFRVALTHLCLAELAGGDEGKTSFGAVTDWLTGRNTAISAVKPYQIFNRITRTNARHLFESLLQAVRFSGRKGLVLVLDISQIFIKKPADDSFVRYSKSSVLDTYEVLRQFLDSVERMSGLFGVIVAPSSFLEEGNDRSIDIYSALKFRIFDEVRDRNVYNPMASLLRFSSLTRGVV